MKNAIALLLALSLCAAPVRAVETARRFHPAQASASMLAQQARAEQEARKLAALDTLEVDAELYLPLGQRSDGLIQNRGGRVVSLRPEVVRAEADTGALEGLAPGMAVIECLDQREQVVSRARVYCFRPTALQRDEKHNSRENPSVLHSSNSASAASSDRSWRLICQQLQKDKFYGTYLSRHGCTVCAAAAVCRAWGAEEMTVDWMMRGGLERVAKQTGRSFQDDALGYYGLQRLLQYGGISSEIYGNWPSLPAATEELVKTLSEGRPVLLYVDNKAVWNGIGPLCAALHCVVLIGISEEGHVQIINSSQPHCVSGFKYGGSLHQVELTPGQLLEHFTRTSHPKREKEDDFYFTKKGGLRTFLKITCDRAEPTQ